MNTRDDFDRHERFSLVKALVYMNQVVQVNTVSVFDENSKPCWIDAVVDYPLASQFTATTAEGAQVYRLYKDKGNTWRET